MKYAELEGKRIEAQQGIKNAICPICKDPVVPRCGHVRIHHWAHKSKQNCDPWWEPETEWHRNWKNCFLEECQEIIMYDELTNEKHVADVRTQAGTVIEFQHSPMNLEEQQSREQFYKNMIWVIDAKQYYERFKEYVDGNRFEKNERRKNYFHIKCNRWDLNNFCFPTRWLNASVPVLFDFGVHDPDDKLKGGLYCVFPEKLKDHDALTVCCMYISLNNFIKCVTQNNSFFPNIDFLKMKAKELKEEHRILKEEEITLRRQKKWREAISETFKALDKKTLRPTEIFVSKKYGNILDSSFRSKYNSCRCMILSERVFFADYKGRKYSRPQVLLLIEYKDVIVPATLYIPFRIYRDFWEYIDEGSCKDYRYSILQMNTHYQQSYNNFCIHFKSIEQLYKTKESTKCINNIVEKWEWKKDYY